MSKNPVWAGQIERRWKKIAPETAKNQAKALRSGVRLLQQWGPAPPVSGVLSGQPFDGHLLALSKVYRKSRKLFLKGGGKHTAALVSSPRTLGAASLLDNEIEYSPVEKELLWMAGEPLHRANLAYLLSLRGFVTSLFHEQSHRILWAILPAAPNTADGVRLYLNFVESLVVTLDMVLGDELGSTLSTLFHHCGIVYDPGTDILAEMPNSRVYRNYLQSTLLSTFLYLEMYSPKDIAKVVKYHFAFTLGEELCERAIRRSLQLDAKFVQRTNPIWQYRHRKVIRSRLTATEPGKKSVLVLSSDPLESSAQYLWAERWFDLMGV